MPPPPISQLSPIGIGTARGALEPCPLCGSGDPERLMVSMVRPLLRCTRCGLLFVPSAERPDSVEERSRYDDHENDPEDPRYRAFLARLTDPLLPRLRPGQEGLDYGAGPGPALQAMLEEAGFPTRIWDPFYHDDREVLRRRYDFITCTETAEHFHRPGRGFRRLNRLLREGGWLGLMTQPPPPERELPDWYYLRDPTHVCFYSRDTLTWIAARFGWEATFLPRGVTLFRKTDRKADPTLHHPEHQAS